MDMKAKEVSDSVKEMTGGMKELSGGMRVLAIIVCLLMIGAGLFLFVVPASVVWLFAFAVFARGIGLIVNYVASKDARRGWDLLSGAIDILFGAMMLFGTVEMKVAGVVTIEIFVAIWILFTGFTRLFSGFGLKKEGAKGWGWTLVGGILAILAGAVFLIWPLMGAVTLVGFAGIFAGISFVIVGVTGLAGALSFGGKKGGN